MEKNILDKLLFGLFLRLVDQNLFRMTKLRENISHSSLTPGLETPCKRTQRPGRKSNVRKTSSYKHVPHCLKPPHLVAKRNARERLRVQEVNSAFAKLGRYVPSETRHKRLSKVKTLRLAIAYIRGLQNLIAEHDRRPHGNSHLPETLGTIRNNNKINSFLDAPCHIKDSNTESNAGKDYGTVITNYLDSTSFYNKRLDAPVLASFENKNVSGRENLSWKYSAEPTCPTHHFLPQQACHIDPVVLQLSNLRPGSCDGNSKILSIVAQSQEVGQLWCSGRDMDDNHFYRFMNDNTVNTSHNSYPMSELTSSGQF